MEWGEIRVGGSLSPRPSIVFYIIAGHISQEVNGEQISIPN